MDPTLFILNFFIMSQKKFTAHNYTHRGFVTKLPSVTIPGQVMSLTQILDRFRRGQSVQSFPPVYNPEFPPGYEELSKIEKIELAREQSSKVNQMRRSLLQKAADEKAQEQAAKEAAKQAAQGASDTPEQ